MARLKLPIFSLPLLWWWIYIFQAFPLLLRAGYGVLLQPIFSLLPTFGLWDHFSHLGAGRTHIFAASPLLQMNIYYTRCYILQYFLISKILLDLVLADWGFRSDLCSLV
jgi:hypothetical protein